MVTKLVFTAVTIVFHPVFVLLLSEHLFHASVRSQAFLKRNTRDLVRKFAKRFPDQCNALSGAAEGIVNGRTLPVGAMLIKL